MKTGRALRGALTVGVLFLFLALFPFRAWGDGPRRLSVVIFPTENTTGLEVWESKYYPYNVLERKMSDYLEVLFKRSALIDVRVLDENGMNRWLNGPRKPDDMAVQMELFEARLKEREVMGRVDTGTVNLRMRLFDARRAEQFATRTASGADRRYTFEGAENLYWMDVAFVSLPFPLKGGLDLFGLTGTRDRGQRMSRPTWSQFRDSSHWQAIQNAISDAYDQAMGQVSAAIRRNEPDAEAEGRDFFSPSFTTVGRIISPTANSKRKRREYIISLGRQDSIRVGDVLEVVRSDTYVTVDPEHPVVVLPKTVGKVKVLSVQEKNAVVRVIRDNKKEPIQLKDIVIKVTGPRS
ncbi:MAG: hypothetical protein GX256_07040 [Fretibacterium sp.]|nr:hypothetical protein [Fretibacterium sp.]